MVKKLPIANCRCLIGLKSQNIYGFESVEMQVTLKNFPQRGPRQRVMRLSAVKDKMILPSSALSFMERNLILLNPGMQTFNSIMLLIIAVISANLQ